MEITFHLAVVDVVHVVVYGAGAALHLDVIGEDIIGTASEPNLEQSET